jgi:hypothetical protein
MIADRFEGLTRWWQGDKKDDKKDKKEKKEDKKDKNKNKNKKKEHVHAPLNFNEMLGKSPKTGRDARGGQTISQPPGKGLGI